MSKITQAETSITMPEGAILRLVRYHNSTKKSDGPPHCRLEAQREDEIVTLELEECVAPPSMPQLLELCRLRVSAIIKRGIPELEPEKGTIENFVWKMQDTGMCLPEFFSPAA